MRRPLKTSIGAALALAAAVTLSACAASGTADDASDAPTAVDSTARRAAPDAVGAVAALTMGKDGVLVTFTPDAGYEYFADAALTIPFTAAFAVDGEQSLDIESLAVGDRIRVWAPVCAESYPVQCQVEAVTAD